MTAIGSTIEQLRQERHWTPAQLGVKVGLSEKEIIRRESGQAPVTPRERFAFAQAFGMSIIEFDECWRRYIASQHTARHHPDSPGIPLINYDSSGYIADYQEPDVEAGEDHAYIDFGDIDDASAFGVIVVGDSMAPVLQAGDCVILTPLDPQCANGELDQGKVVFIRFSREYGGGCALARYAGEDDERIRFEQDGSAHQSFATAKTLKRWL